MNRVNGTTTISHESEEDSENVGVALKEKSSSHSNSNTSWILMNYSKGHCSMVVMDKHALMDLAQIHHRDLRILDPLLSYPSAILGREKSILLNLEHIKAIITAEEVLVRDPLDEKVVPVVEQLKRRLGPFGAIHKHNQDGDYQQDIEGFEEESTMEFQALEVALEAICSFLAARTTELELATYHSLDELTNKISSLNLDRVRKLKSTTTRLTIKAHKVRDELERLLDDDQDMAELYLSRKSIVGAFSSPISGSGVTNNNYNNKGSNCPTIGSKICTVTTASLATIHGEENDVKELEMLLEAYFEHIDGTLKKLITLREYIDSTEDYINIQIDSRRNQLIKLELVLSSATLCITIFSLVTGIFGVNIPYHWNQNHGYMFKWVIIVTASCTSSLFITIVSYARKKGLI